MNRFICDDMYDFEMVEAIARWRKMMKEVVNPDYNEYAIQTIDVDGREYWRINYRKNVPDHVSGAWRYFMDRFQGMGDLIASFYVYDSENDYQYEAPERYYYSNGSVPRVNRMAGWH